MLRCCLTLLGLSLVLCGDAVSSQPDLDLLRNRRLLQRARALGVAAQVSQLTQNVLAPSCCCKIPRSGVPLVTDQVITLVSHS